VSRENSVCNFRSARIVEKQKDKEGRGKKDAVKKMVVFIPQLEKKKCVFAQWGG